MKAGGLASSQPEEPQGGEPRKLGQAGWLQLCPTLSPWGAPLPPAVTACALCGSGRVLRCPSAAFVFGERLVVYVWEGGECFHLRPQGSVFWAWKGWGRFRTRMAFRSPCALGSLGIHQDSHRAWLPIYFLSWSSQSSKQ